MGISQRDVGTGKSLKEWCQAEASQNSEYFREDYFADVTVSDVCRAICEAIMEVHGLSQMDLAVSVLGLSPSGLKNRVLKALSLRNSTVRKIAALCGWDYNNSDHTNFSPTAAWDHIHSLNLAEIYKKPQLSLEEGFDTESVVQLACAQIERHSMQDWEHYFDVDYSDFTDASPPPYYLNDKPDRLDVTMFRKDIVAYCPDEFPRPSPRLLSTKKTRQTSYCFRLCIGRNGSSSIKTLLLFALDLGSEGAPELINFLTSTLRVYEEKISIKNTRINSDQAETENYQFVALVFGDSGSMKLRNDLEIQIERLPSFLRPQLFYIDPQELIRSNGKKFVINFLKDMVF